MRCTVSLLSGCQFCIPPSAAYLVWCDFPFLTHLLFSKCLLFFSRFWILWDPKHSLWISLRLAFLFPTSEGRQRPACAAWVDGGIKRWEALCVCVCVRTSSSVYCNSNKEVRCATETRRNCSILLRKLWMTFSWLWYSSDGFLGFSLLYGITSIHQMWFIAVINWLLICNKVLNIQKYMCRSGRLLIILTLINVTMITNIPQS